MVFLVDRVAADVFIAPAAGRVIASGFCCDPTVAGAPAFGDVEQNYS
jgi:hypothetical protein